MVIDLFRTSHWKSAAPETRRTYWHGGIGLLLLAVGTHGVLRDAALKSGSETSNAALYAFGLLLCGSIIARFSWGMANLGNASRAEIDGFSRLSSRLVYVLLYSLLGISQMARLMSAEPHWDNGAAFRPYFVCGMAALVFIRLITLHWLRSLGNS
jgi:cytochrome b561